MIKKKSLHRIKTRIKKIIYSDFEPRLSSALLLSSKSFLDLFNIKEVQAFKEKGNFSEAQNALLNYYQLREIPPWPKPSNIITDLRLNLEQMNQQELIQYADSVVDNKFLLDGKKPFFNSDDTINWNQSPISSPEWLWRLHRHQWWPVIGLAYYQTGDERYAKAFVIQMLDWVKKNPLPPKKDEKSFAWRLMETAMRMQISWISAFYLFFHSPVFNKDAKITMLCSIYDHAQFLSHFKTSQNHLLRECNGLASVSTFFPEFKKSKSWLQIAFSRLEEELKKQINPDGFHFELSTGYQWLVTDEFEKTKELLKINNLSLPREDIKIWLEKMYHVLAYIVRPNGTFPEINDGFIRWSSNRLAKAGKQLDRKDFIYIGTHGDQGAIPSKTSLAFENAGYYVMRSDWSKNAKFLLFDCGPYGGFHGHEDKLSIEVFALGTPFIVDSGSYTYESEDPFRAYFVGSQGHNTILVNGSSQVRRWSPDSMQAKRSSESTAIWVSKDDFDYAKGTFNEGYGHFALQKPQHAPIIDDVTHTRHILFVKPDYWLIVDELTSSEHYRYQLLFHAHPELEVAIHPGSSVMLKNQKLNSDLFIIPAESNHIKVKLETGSESPIQGWYSVDHHFKTPATTITYEFEGSKYTVIATLIYPNKIQSSCESIQLKPIEVFHGEGQAYRIKNDQGTDYLLISKSKGLKKFGNYQSSEIVAGIRLDKHGQVFTRFEG